ncbi:MAG: hypothetical protein GY915_07235 [bacterium]|nr:hypothetical protein [bacterium]
MRPEPKREDTNLSNTSPALVQFTSTPEELATTFQILASMKMDDMTYTHGSIRDSEQLDSYWVNPLGPLFSQIKPEHLVQLNFEGQVLEKGSGPHNPTGENIHGPIYDARPEVGAILHFHTPATIAVSAVKCGLLPLSQFSLHFFENISYHSYGGLVLDKSEQGAVAQSLGSNSALLMRNHGALTVGRTIQEAFFYASFLEKACQSQVQTLSQGQPFHVPSNDICRKAKRQMRGFEKDLGRRDWNACAREI